ncbi:tRNA lysidine(34) synthetase TilS [Corynebacterium otitidis]
MGVRRIGRVELPHDPPAFLKARLAVRRHPWPGGRGIAVGLSGGADSLALTAALAAERPGGSEPLAVVVDHGLQKGSAAAARDAAREARRLGLECRVVAVRVAGPGGEEAAARRARYAALADAAEGRAIAVAHTENDQAEGFLLGGLRGQPAGMAAASELAGAPGGLHRPFLGLRRADTAAACRELDLRVWSDPANADRRFRRVAIREEILPALERLTGADPIGPLAAAAARARLEQDAVAERADGIDAGSCEELAAAPPAVRREAIARLIRGAGAAPTAASIEQVEALVTRWRGQGPVAVGGRGGARLEVHRARGRLALFRQKGAPDA